MKDWLILLIVLVCCSAPVLLGLLALKGIERTRIRCPAIPRTIQRFEDVLRKYVTAAVVVLTVGGVILMFLVFFIWIVKTIWYLV